MMYKQSTTVIVLYMFLLFYRHLGLWVLILACEMIMPYSSGFKSALWIIMLSNIRPTARLTNKLKNYSSLLKTETVITRLKCGNHFISSQVAGRGHQRLVASRNDSVYGRLGWSPYWRFVDSVPGGYPFSFVGGSRTYTQVSPTEFYDVLGLTPKATSEQIKATYFKLSKIYHPDVCKDPGGVEKFVLISKAYEVTQGCIVVFDIEHERTPKHWCAIVHSCALGTGDDG